MERIKVVIRHEIYRVKWPWRLYVLDVSSTGELFPRWEAGAFGSRAEAIEFARKRGWEVWF